MRIKKREDELKAQLFDEARKLPTSYFLLPIQDVRKSGTPDFTFNGANRTSWWEVKHATPNFESPGIQEVTCHRLARTSFCRYIIYVDTAVKWATGIKREKFAVILHPKFVFQQKGKLDWNAALFIADAVFNRFDHEGIVQHMLKAHTQ